MKCIETMPTFEDDILVECEGEMINVGRVSTKSFNWGIEKEKCLYQCEICKTIKLV